MLTLRRIAIVLFSVFVIVRPPAAMVRPTAEVAADVHRTHRAHPLRFEENVGQVDGRVRFVARRGHATLFAEDGGAMLVAGGAVLRLGVDGGKAVLPVASDELVTKANYFLGNDPAKWRTGVRTFGRITYPGVREGVDLVFHGEEGQIEYDFVVAPGADASAVAMTIDGGDALTLTDAGDLAIHTAAGVIVQERPRVYQRTDEGLRDVRASYRLVGAKSVGFELAAYDRTRPLVIDPTVTYATYFGSTANTNGDSDSFTGIRGDDAGNAYAVGVASMQNYPGSTTVHALGANANHAVITKLDPTGAITWVTYAGGQDGSDGANAVAVDASGRTYVAGNSSSTSFPTTTGAATTPAGGFILVLDATGALVYSTYDGLTRTDLLRAIALSPDGNTIYAGGFTTDAGGSALLAVASLGTAPTNIELCTAPSSCPSAPISAIAVDPTDGSLYLGGGALAGDGVETRVAAAPMTGPQPSTGAASGFVLRLDATALGAGPTLPSAAIRWGTLLGSSGFAEVRALAATGGGVVYATGNAQCGNPFNCSPAFPVTANAYKSTLQTLPPTNDAFVTKLDTTTSGAASLVYSTLLGGFLDDYGSGIGVDAAGLAYVGGYTGSSDFPTTTGTASAGGAYDAFVTQVSVDGSSLIYSTLFGGSQVDSGFALDVRNHRVFVSGQTNSSDFPTTHPAQAALAGGNDGFIIDLAFTPPSLSPASLALTAGGTQAFTATGLGPFTYALTTNASGGSINASTGAYTAGSKAGTDVVTVTDKFNLTATAQITVTPLAITPAIVSLTGGGSQVFTASGTGPFTFVLVANPSGGTINAGTGVYTAGPNAGTDVIQVTDINGSTATAQVTVTAAPPPADLVLTPSATTTPPRGRTTLTASGGTLPYVFTFASNASGASIADGAYVAGPRPNVVDTIRVVDGTGQEQTATVAVGAGITIAPAAPSVGAQGQIAFTAAGGSSSGFAWSATGGTIDGASGAFTAPSAAGVVTVSVRDALGNTASVNVSVAGAIAIAPAAPSTYPRGTVQLAAGGGAGGVGWTVLTSPPTGGTVDANGLFTAGPTGDVTETVEARDRSGAHATVTIAVGPGLTITPATTALTSGAALSFGGAGGSGAGYTYRLATNASGATLAGDRYMAGPNAGSDVVTLVDSAGNEARATIAVTKAPSSTTSSSSSSSSSSGGTSTPPATSSAPTTTVGSTGSGGCATTPSSASEPLLGALLALAWIFARRRNPLESRST